MKRTPLAAMLTLLAAMVVTIALAGCGSKAASVSHSQTTNGGTTSTTHARKLPSKPTTY